MIRLKNTKIPTTKGGAYKLDQFINRFQYQSSYLALLRQQTLAFVKRLICTLTAFPIRKVSLKPGSGRTSIKF